MATLDNSTDTQTRVLAELLDAVEQADIPIWFYGGYALDALENTTLRTHSDIDFLFDAVDQSRLRETLAERGFEICESGAYHAFFKRHGHRVESLAFERWPDGRLVTDSGDTGAFPWPETSLPDEPNGVLLGRPVRALTYDGQYVFKAGYSAFDPRLQLREKDQEDLKLITQRVSAERRKELQAYFEAIPGTRKHYPDN